MKTRKERFTEWLLAGISTLSILSMGGIVLFLLLDGIPFFKFYPLTDFLFGLDWYPTDDPMEFGILPLIVGSLAVMALATVIAVPLGVATAIYLSEVARPGMRRIVKPFVELLAALPSVVIGFFGMVVVAPFLQDYLGASTGLNLLNAGLMLAFMSVPIICSVAEDAIYSVPRELREASLSLGATKWETLTRVVLPAASSGIGTAVMLGMSRSIGETMVVLMVAGGAAVIPTSLFDSVRPIPASPTIFVSASTTSPAFPPSCSVCSAFRSSSRFSASVSAFCRAYSPLPF